MTGLVSIVARAAVRRECGVKAPLRCVAVKPGADADTQRQRARAAHQPARYTTTRARLCAASAARRGPPRPVHEGRAAHEDGVSGSCVGIAEVQCN